jgi:hypothetical protein
MPLETLPATKGRLLPSRVNFPKNTALGLRVEFSGKLSDQLTWRRLMQRPALTTTQNLDFSGSISDSILARD